MSRPTRSTPAGRANLDRQNRARRERRSTQELLTMYVVERWWERLSRSPYAADFILKGGMLLAAFGHRRATSDADALARNLASDEASVMARVVEVASLPGDDGVEFLADTVRASVIRDDSLYSGVRVIMDARLATAQMKLQLDVNFGDPVIPAPREIDLPPLRPGFPPVRLLGYPLATMLAEKLVTAIDLGPANTRVRDFVDIYTLTRGDVVIPRDELRAAARATADFRGVALRALSESLGDLAVARASTYAAYRSGLGPDGAHLPEALEEVIDAVIAFSEEYLE